MAYPTESTSPDTMGIGSIWAGWHPEEHAQEVAEAKARVEAADEKLKRGEDVSPAELDPSTSRVIYNDPTRII